MLVSARLQGKAGKAVGPSSVADSKLCERKRKQEENRNGTIAHSGKNRICFQRENESSAPACFSTCNFLTRLSTLSGSSFSRGSQSHKRGLWNASSLLLSRQVNSICQRRA